MNPRCALLLICLALAACNSSSSLPQPSNSTLPRSYTAATAAGGFFEFDIQPDTSAVKVTNLRTGTIDLVPYTNAPDGSFTLQDPNANFTAATEFNGQLLVVNSTQGDSQDVVPGPSLVVGAPLSAVRVAGLAGQQLNCFRFTTTPGGFEFGTMRYNADGSYSVATYYPFGAVYNMTSLHEGQTSGTSSVGGSEGQYIVFSAANGWTNYLFNSPSGFIISEPDDTYLVFNNAPSKDFDSVKAGTYTIAAAVKKDARFDGAYEGGVTSFDKLTLAVGTNGSVTLKDGSGNTLTEGTLSPVADDSDLYIPDTWYTLPEPCNGLFEIIPSTGSQTTTAEPKPNSVGGSGPIQTDVYIGFQGNLVVLGGLTHHTPANPTDPYTYFYGVGVQ